jgi:hypothetical protein
VILDPKCSKLGLPSGAILNNNCLYGDFEVKGSSPSLLCFHVFDALGLCTGYAGRPQAPRDGNLWKDRKRGP